jgi:hypothetical protein
MVRKSQAGNYPSKTIIVMETFYRLVKYKFLPAVINSVPIRDFFLTTFANGNK